jgi:hypothetical protein
MFFRLKPSGPRSYLQIVANRRESGVHRQHVLATIGRVDELAASGGLAALLTSGARLCDQVMLISTLAGDAEGPRLSTHRIGAPLLFGRLWQETGCQAVIEALLAGRGFEFAVERAVFATVLHRIMASGSDRACEKWLADYDVPGVEGLALHHLYRAMAWLGEELPAEQQPGATPFAPRCVKDQIEEALFARRRDLFSELSIVFMDTTSLRFEGAGGESLGRRGHSKDHRPDLMQMVLCVVVDADGRPICTEMWPGNTADVSVLLPVVDRLRHRFAIGRVCVVADRGMISAATLEGLEQRGLEYILGARERTDRLVRDVVLADERAFVPLLVERANGAETQLFAKEVRLEGRRYIVCRNEAEAEKDRAGRQAVIAGLEQQLRKGDKALIGNSAYRRYLRRARSADGDTGPAFEIDPGKLAEEAKYDGIFVLRTNARVTPLQAMMRICFVGRKPSCAPGRSTTPPMPPSAATSSAPSSPSSCRTSCCAAAAPRASSRNGATCCATSIACSGARSSRAARPGAFAPRPAPPSQPCSGPAASPCRRASRASRHPRLPRPAHHPHRSAGDDPGVVPRAPNFPVFASQISYLQIRGVEVGSNGSDWMLTTQMAA